MGRPAKRGKEMAPEFGRNPYGAASGRSHWKCDIPISFASSELLTIKARYKRPRGLFSKKLEYPVQGQLARFEDASEDSRWVTAVATFGMALRESAHRGSASLDMAFELGKGALGKDREGYRAEMLGLVGKARQLAGK